MNAELEIPEEFKLPASAGKEELELSFRRDYGLGGITHRAYIAPLIRMITAPIVPNELTLSSRREGLAEPATERLTSPTRSEGFAPSANSHSLPKPEEKVSLSKNDEASLFRLFVRRTIPFGLFLILALVTVSLDTLTSGLRTILIVVGIGLVGWTFFLWFPRNHQTGGRANFPSK